MIHKYDNLESSNHYRSISLCNVCYKIIAKILANVVKPLLNKIVFPLQGAFAPRRLINDNVLLAHEIMHSFKKKKGKSGYDRLEWGFIRVILFKMSFHLKWIEWVIENISIVSYSILINGISKGKI